MDENGYSFAANVWIQLVWRMVMKNLLDFLDELEKYPILFLVVVKGEKNKIINIIIKW